MPVIQIQGLHRLKGEIRIQGSKNAVLPVMAASLLHKGITEISNVPGIQDVFCMMGILEYMGCKCHLENHRLTIDASQPRAVCIPDEMVKKMRSSIMLLGPMLGRLREAQTSQPGGCYIGKRPIDLHLYALREMGADIREEDGRITAVTMGLRGADLHFAYPSVGATENALMAAVAAEGTTRIYGAAREPEIQVLCRFLQAMGARIDGVGSGQLTIRGNDSLRGADFAMPGDRIVAGTYMGAVLAAGGDVMLKGAPTEHLRQVLEAAAEVGGMLRISEDGIRIRMKSRPKALDLDTGPYPEFPTDLQSVMLAVASVSEGVSRIRENVFEGRFATAKELQKLGGHIIIKDRTAIVRGRETLKGGMVYACDLRGGAALTVAGLAADGNTSISGYGFISRGYEDICRDLACAGACIWLEEE